MSVTKPRFKHFTYIFDFFLFHLYIFDIHFVNLTEVECICLPDFGKVL